MGFRQAIKQYSIKSFNDKKYSDSSSLSLKSVKSSLDYYKIHRKSGKKARQIMMENPYFCIKELDELSSDDSIIDYSVFIDDSFVLILLLTSKGEVQAYLETGKDTKPRKNVVDIKQIISISINPVTICIGSQAAFVVFGLSDGNLMVTPIKSIIDVTWGASSWSTTTVIDLSLQSVNSCLSLPTCTKCFTSNFPPRAMAVMANKAGNILLVDLQLRKCVSELKAPQSLHNIDVLLDENSIELMVTGFTGAQWIIPIERNGKGFREVLTTCVPSDLHVLGPPTTQFFTSESFNVIALDTSESVVEIYSTIHSLAHSSKRTFKVPPETWMVYSSDNVLFTVSNENELRSALHFGFTSVRLEYTLVKISTEWRPIALIPMPKKLNKLSGVFVVNERGLVRVEQSNTLSLSKIASEFIFRLPPLQISISSIAQVANACKIDIAELQTTLIPNILSIRKSRQLTQKELSQILTISKKLNISMTDLLKTFENDLMSEQLLPEVLNAIQKNPSKNDNLMQRVIDMYVKKALLSSDNADKIREIDSELSSFLARHENLYQGSVECAKAGLWKCAQTLYQRHINVTGCDNDGTDILLHFVKNGLHIWKKSNQIDRLQIMSLICHLNWSKLSDSDGSKVCALLSAWQRDINLPSYHEMCLRVATANQLKFKRPCQILSLVSSIYILSEKRVLNPSCIPEYEPLSAGHNCGAAIADDDRIFIWGNFMNTQQKAFDITNINSKNKKSEASTSVTTALSTTKPQQSLPHVLEYPGGRPRAISCGAEHVMVLSVSGQLSTWGGNRYGQCGVGHNYRLANLQQIDGNWPTIQQISCGQFHSAFICEDGSLWTFGWGLYGQLGHGGRNNSNYSIPKKVNGLIEKIKQVSCGRAHTVALTLNGRVLVSGSGSYGQMGTNEDIKKTFAFTSININEPVTQVCTSFYHSICITENDRIYEWGRSPQEIKMRMFVMKKLRSAQLKNEESNSDGQQVRVNMNLPSEVPREDLGLREVKHLLDGKILKISCGLSHSALITEKESLYTWGKSLDFQLGHGNKAERSEPHQVFEPKNTLWKTVVCGNNHTIASTNVGHVFGWGKNDFTQCGTITKKNTDSSEETTKRIYFQTKDNKKRFIPNIDDTQFAQRPTIIPDVRIKNDGTNYDSSIDEENIVKKLKEADITVVQAVSRHLCSLLEDDISNEINGDESSIITTIENGETDNKYNGENGPICSATAFVHLMAGDIRRAIRMIKLLKLDKNTSKDSLSALSSLIWDIMANHEDVQSKKALSEAFRNVPMSDSMRKGKQIAQLWPVVWNDESVQNSLNIDEKIAMLDSFTSATKSSNYASIPSSSLEVSSKIRLFAQCSHAEPAIVGTPPECSACVNEWTEKVRATLGASQ